jgi:hypothetical protein
MTNIKFVKTLMEFSNYGALVQAFIIQAIVHYCDHIIANEEEVKKSMEKGFISPDAWIGIAKEIKTKIENRKP